MTHVGAARVFILAPTPTLRTGLRSMLAEAGAKTVEVVGASDTSPEDLLALSGADVILVAGEEVPDALSFALSESGTQAVVLISGEEDAVAG
ncbi:MAG: hypothetical protein ACLGI3_16160, partial [Actinomycetes bacterium]